MAFGGSLAKFKSFSSGIDTSKKEKAGDIGFRFMELGSHALIALASKNLPDGIAGVRALKPDWLGLGVGILGTALMKEDKKPHRALRKSSRALAFGSAHALITRWITTSEMPLPFINGPAASV